MNLFNTTYAQAENFRPSTFMDFIRIEINTLAQLLSNSKQGDTESFSEISHHVRNISYSYFLSKYHLKKIINKDDVDDLTNNVYLAFAEQYQTIRNLTNWLRRVLFLTFIKWYKSQKVSLTTELHNNLKDSDQEQICSDLLDVNKILEVLETLSEDKQTILKLRFWGGLKFAEIGEALNKKEVTVKKMFYRTLAEIKSQLE